MSETLTLKHSRDYYHYLGKVIDKIIENENVIKNDINSDKSTNFTVNQLEWVNMAGQLEMEGIAKHNFSVIIRKDIEEQLWQKYYQDIPREEFSWRPGNYWRFANKQGWTNHDHARNVKSDSQGSQENSSINTPNKNMVDIFNQIKEICNLGIEKIKNFPEFEELFNKKELLEFYNQQEIIISNCKDGIDNKTKIPERLELLFHLCIAAQSGLNNGVIFYFNERLKLFIDQRKKLLTAKQATKYLKGGKVSTLPLLRHFTRDSAIFGGKFGVQCNCGSWMVDQIQGNTVECFDCSLKFTAATLTKCRCCQNLLFKDELLYIEKTGNCEICNTSINLPKELLVNLIKN